MKLWASLPDIKKLVLNTYISFPTQWHNVDLIARLTIKMAVFRSQIVKIVFNTMFGVSGLLTQAKVAEIVCKPAEKKCLKIFYIGCSS